MKFEIPVEQLHSAVGLAGRFVGRQQNLPILTCVLLSADHGVVLVRATNLECGVEISVSAKVLESGSVAVPVGVLLGFLSTTRAKYITGSIVGGVLKLQGEKVSASIKTVPHGDFPTLPRISAEHSFSIKTTDVARALRSVVHCAAVSIVKPELQSVFIAGEAGKLTLAATDSFRLAEKVVPLKSRGSITPMLLPARNAAELVRILESASGDVEVYYNEHQLSLHVGDVYYTSRLLDGTFPNYRQVVPKTFTTEAVILREDLAQSLKSLTVFSDKFLQVALVVNPKQKTIELSSNNQEVGEEECVVKAAVSGAETKMTFNSRYVADGLLPISGESVRLQMNGPGKPMVIKDVSEESYFYLAMPMNR